MKINRDTWQLSNWFFPLTLLAFIGPSIQYLSSILTLNTRWILLGLLFLQMLLSMGKNRLPVPLFLITIVYIAWCYLTWFWSDVPMLSLMKVSAFALVMFSMTLAGQQWASRVPVARVFDGFSLFVLASLSATFLGYKAETAYDIVSNEVRLYQGLVGGPNMLGSLLAMSSAFIGWKLFNHWHDKRKRYVWLLVLSSAVFFILQSQSRSALLLMLCMAGGLIFSQGRRRIVPFMFGLSLLLIAIYATAPELQERVTQRVIYKHATEGQGIFYTRQQPWAESFGKALEGGLIGGGYGVTIGAPPLETQGFTSIGYGREKGNSQLAIIEETGVVGFLLYLLMIVSFGRYMFIAYRTAPNLQLKTALAIIIGTLIGMLLQSMFEAWWVAPGSPESVAFWAFAGLGLGLAKVVKQETRAFALQQRKPPSMSDRYRRR